MKSDVLSTVVCCFISALISVVTFYALIKNAEDPKMRCLLNGLHVTCPQCLAIVGIKSADIPLRGSGEWWDVVSGECEDCGTEITIHRFKNKEKFKKHMESLKNQ